MHVTMLTWTQWLARAKQMGLFQSMLGETSQGGSDGGKRL